MRYEELAQWIPLKILRSSFNKYDFANAMQRRVSLIPLQETSSQPKGTTHNQKSIFDVMSKVN